MVASNVQINLQDESSYIPSGSSIYAGIAGDFKKGPLEPVLCTSQAQFLNWFAPDGKPKIGYPSCYQSALDYLADADALWVSRAISSSNPALYGGLTITTSSVSDGYTQWTSGKTESALDNFSFDTNDVCYIAGCNPGVWNNDIAITFKSNTTIGITGAYDIDVYKKVGTSSDSIDYGSVLESFTVSFGLQDIDGYGNTLYIENVVNGNSNYIRVKHNTSQTGSPKGVLTQILFSGGTDGDAVADSDIITAIDKLSNPDEYSVQLLLDGGNSSTNYAKHLLELAGTTRLGECFCVLSTDESDEVNTSGNAITNLKTYRQAIATQYNYLGSLYTPHVKVYDRFNDVYNFVAPDGMAASRINAAIRDYGYNYPAAGYTRGLLDSAIDVKTKFSGGELNQLDDLQINVIKNDPTRGIVIMGNSTLHSTPSDKQDQNNMLVANLQIKPGLREFLKDYLYELNDEITRSIIISKINIFMKDVKAQRGVSDFYVVCDSTNNSATDVASGILNITLYVKFIKAIKFIKCNIVATAQGLDFSDFT